MNGKNVYCSERVNVLLPVYLSVVEVIHYAEYSVYTLHRRTVINLLNEQITEKEGDSRQYISDTMSLTNDTDSDIRQNTAHRTGNVVIDNEVIIINHHHCFDETATYNSRLFGTSDTCK